jgi:hypothetical protein
MINEERLSAWRGQLAKRYVRVTGFHTELRSSFMREVDSGTAYEHHHALDELGYRRCIDGTMQQLLDCTSKLLALGVDEVARGAIVARFESAVLVESKRKLADKRTSIARQLAAAFPASAFQLEFDELP